MTQNELPKGANMPKQQTQLTRISAALKKGPLTRLQAFQRFGCCNLWARVAELRERGLKIQSQRVTVKNRYGERCRVARYRLV